MAVLAYADDPAAAKLAAGRAQRRSPRPEPLPSQRRAVSCSPVSGAAQPSRAVSLQLSLAAFHRWIEIQRIRSTRTKPDLSRPWSFAKEPLGSSKIKPQSISTQKKFQNSPKLFA